MERNTNAWATITKELDGHYAIVVQANKSTMAMPESILLTPTAAEKLVYELGSVVNTLRGVQKKLSLRERIALAFRSLRG